MLRALAAFFVAIARFLMRQGKREERTFMLGTASFFRAVTYYGHVGGDLADG
ncbi:MAG: hypothetical protein AAGK71_08880 [Pseudomonadota bacterium]